jgi:hypothetical protein
MKKSDIAIASPCGQDWRSMTPRDGGRFCGDCKKVVRNLSDLSEQDARTLLDANTNAELCVRYLHDKHGKVFFAGEVPAHARIIPIGALLQRAKYVAAAAALMSTATGCELVGSGPHESEQEVHENMGGAPWQPPPPVPEAEDAGTDASVKADANAADASVVNDSGEPAPCDAATCPVQN